MTRPGPVALPGNGRRRRCGDRRGRRDPDRRRRRPADGRGRRKLHGRRPPALDRPARVVPVTGGAAGAGLGPAAPAGAAGARGTGGAGGAPGRCGPATCNGCCAGTVCVPLPTARQCGSRGAACTACGACQLCSAAGQCALDPGSQWTIAVENARVTTLAPNGGFWDPAKGDEGGVAPDLFCEYENPANDVSPTTAGVTATLVDVYSAAWNTTITPAGVTVSASALMAAKPAWRIWVGDEDCSKPNVCGQGQIACSYQQPITAAALTSGSSFASRTIQNCLALNLQFIVRQPLRAEALGRSKGATTRRLRPW